MWLQKYFLLTLSEKLDPLFSYIEPLHLEPVWFKFLNQEEKIKYDNTYKKYFDFGNYIFMFSKWHHLTGFDKEKLELPITTQLHRQKVDTHNLHIPVDILEENSYREFLERVLIYGEKAISEFRLFRDIGLARKEEHH
ncbi:hypothetical protein [Solidesulfovibrio alcoholivorans]|uniref:hypothetical protein n=1 Tax=Solidesulfovibrio alcoholivorans TaxID=81406 RepID=UPI0012EC9FBA|nr:hypothetical protein [Solidesulfovibrio alcoholivorans]